MRSSNNWTILTISELHKAAQNGDIAAKNQLLARLSESFMLFVQHRVRDKQDAEEVVQEAMMTIAAKIDHTEITVSLAAWAHKILENKVLHYYRTKKYHRDRFDTRADVDGIATQLNPDLKLRLLSCLRKIHAANPRHARILNLHYQGYGPTEICSKLGITRNNVYIILCRARAMLKQCLESEESE
ncbi:MAG: sigma-70 family RNA polymerase sigma factor [bacterium]